MTDENFYKNLFKTVFTSYYYQSINNKRKLQGVYKQPDRFYLSLTHHVLEIETFLVLIIFKENFTFY